MKTLFVYGQIINSTQFTEDAFTLAAPTHRIGRKFGTVQKSALQQNEILPLTFKNTSKTGNGFSLLCSVINHELNDTWRIYTTEDRIIPVQCDTLATHFRTHTHGQTIIGWEILTHFHDSRLGSKWPHGLVKKQRKKNRTSSETVRTIRTHTYNQAYALNSRFLYVLPLLLLLLLHCAVHWDRLCVRVGFGM